MTYSLDLKGVWGIIYNRKRMNDAAKTISFGGGWRPDSKHDNNRDMEGDWRAGNRWEVVETGKRKQRHPKSTRDAKSKHNTERARKGPEGKKAETSPKTTKPQGDSRNQAVKGRAKQHAKASQPPRRESSRRRPVKTEAKAAIPVVHQPQVKTDTTAIDTRACGHRPQISAAGMVYLKQEVWQTEAVNQRMLQMERDKREKSRFHSNYTKSAGDS